MTKPLPTGFIKDNDDISWEKLNFLLEKVCFEDTVGHLFIVNIEFDTENATEREFAYNEIYLPIIEKQRIIDPCERSVLQLLEQFIRGKNAPKVYRSTRLMQIFFKKLFCRCI